MVRHHDHGNSFFFIYLFIYYVYNILSACMPAGQKRAPDLITDGCEPPCGCWELNSGPLEEQAMFLTSEPSLQSLVYNFLSSLYILKIKPLSDVGLVKIFSHFVGCCFVLLTVSFALQKLLSFRRSHLFIVVFIICSIGIICRKWGLERWLRG